MSKTEDTGRSWEYTTTSDNLIYSLENGGWAGHDYLLPSVYRDTSLWSGPALSKTRKDYLVDPGEYTYDETSGTITFKTSQPPSEYIYVTLDYPYLRANNDNNKLCLDCHTQQTHREINCLTCHQAHDTDNLAGVRQRVRASSRTSIAVRFHSYSGMGSFADGDSVYDGICEVCHTQTKYYRRDGSGSVFHKYSSNMNRKDCTSCHSHANGFNAVMASVVSPGNGSTIGGIAMVAVTGDTTAGSITAMDVSIDGGQWQSCSYNTITGYYEYMLNTGAYSSGLHTIASKATAGSLSTTSNPVTVTVNDTFPWLNIYILAPASRSKVSGVTKIVVRVTTNDLGISSTTVQIDGGAPQNCAYEVSGPYAGYWTFDWDTTFTFNGTHSIRVKAYDWDMWSKYITNIVTVAN